MVAEAIRIGKDPLLTKAAQIATRAKIAEAEEALVAATKAAKDDEKRAMLLEACGAVGLATDEGRALVLECLRSPKQDVAVAAVRAIRAGPMAEAIPVLIGMMRSEDGIVKAEVRVTLERVTGQQFGDRIDLWEAWWRDFGDSFDPRTVKPPAEDELDQTLVDLAHREGRGGAARDAGEGREAGRRPGCTPGHPVGHDRPRAPRAPRGGDGHEGQGLRRSALRWLLEQAVPESTYDAGLVAMASRRSAGRSTAQKVAEAAQGSSCTGRTPTATGATRRATGTTATASTRCSGSAQPRAPASRCRRRSGEAIRDHFLATQNEDGGWNYVPQTQKDISPPA